MSFISSWAQGVIVAVIVASIIEMILPNNSNGKYVKVMIGIFVLFSIISPVVSRFKEGVKGTSSMDSYIDASSREIKQYPSKNLNNEETIKLMYEENLKIDIKSKVSQRGYTVGDIKLDILNNSEYTLNKIELRITAKNEIQNQTTKSTTTIVENIANIKISIGNNGTNQEQEQQSVISESEKRELKRYLSSVYEVNENNIIIN